MKELKILLTITIILILAGCSSLNKYVKQQTPEIKFNAEAP